MLFNSSLLAVLILICSSGIPKLIRLFFILSKVMLSLSIFGWAWNNTIGRMYLPPCFSISTACCSRLLRIRMAQTSTSLGELRFSTITGSFTMFSRFSCMASTKLMILLLSRGVAVNSNMNRGDRLLSSSTLRSALKLWLSSTITNGFCWAITCMSAVGSALSINWSGWT